MKSYFVLLLSVVMNVAYGQSLNLDVDFGDGGKKILTAINYSPKEVFFEDNTYFFVNYVNSACAVNYDGSLVTAFGSNGLLSFNEVGETLSVKGAKLINNFIYVYGQTSNVTNKNVFVVKFSKAGVLDNTFGINGKKVIDLGANEEVINDIVVKSDGTIYATGTQTKSIFLARLAPNGDLDLSFTATGYKVLPMDPNESSIGAGIYEYQNNLLIVGSSKYPTNVWAPPSYLVLLQLDNNGNYVTGFGTNGIKKVNFSIEGDTSSYSAIKSVLTSAGKLYVHYYYAWSFNNQGPRIATYDINTESFQPILMYLNRVTPYYFVEGNHKIYTTGNSLCADISAAHCQRNFQLFKRNSDGTPDTSFNGTGQYTYNFYPNDFYSDDTASVFYLHPDGKILLAGYCYNPYTPSINAPGVGLGMVRLSPSTLSTEIPEENKEISVYPNPAQNEIFIRNENNVEIEEIAIFDVSGKEVVKQKDKYLNNSIDVQHLESGIYFLKIKSQTATVRIKIMISH